MLNFGSLRNGASDQRGAQRFLGASALRHIHCGTDEFTELAGRVDDRVPDRVKVLYRSVVQDDPEFLVDIGIVTKRLHKARNNPAAVFRMQLSPQYCLVGRILPRIETMNSELLIGPVQSSFSRRVVDPASGMRKPLPFR